MTDMRIDATFRDHEKRVRLQSRLGPAGVVALLDLWLWTSQQRPDGDLSGLTEDELEAAGGWRGDRGEFVHALRELQFLDPDGLLHNWGKRNAYLAGSPGRSAHMRRVNHDKAVKRAGGLCSIPRCEFCAADVTSTSSATVSETSSATASVTATTVADTAAMTVTGTYSNIDTETAQQTDIQLAPDQRASNEVAERLAKFGVTVDRKSLGRIGKLVRNYTLNVVLGKVEELGRPGDLETKREPLDYLSACLRNDLAKGNPALVGKSRELTAEEKRKQREADVEFYRPKVEAFVQDNGIPETVEQNHEFRKLRIMGGMDYEHWLRFSQQERRGSESLCTVESETE